MNMQNSYKVVYTSSAEVVGIALKYMTDTERDEDAEWLTQYKDNVSHMLLSFHESKPDSFITCVHRMQQHYPAIVDRSVYCAVLISVTRPVYANHFSSHIQ
jgi:hypothetical protein